MSREHPFRTLHASASIQLSCPACERNFHVCPPDTLVSLTACPHTDCQHVALVCTGEALVRSWLGWHRGEEVVAMSLDSFLEARPPSFGAREAIESIFVIAPVFVLFFVAPLTMWIHAWQQGTQLLTVVAVLTMPAFLVSLLLLLTIGLCVREERRERRGLRAVRRRAFRRARWLTARVRGQARV
jgi:hypothetical protein